MTSRTGRFRALLVGVSDYQAGYGWHPLPFVRDEIEELDRALTDAGYDTVERTAASDMPGMTDAIEDFVRTSDPGDHLLLFLSGHGIHLDGQDFLLAAGANRRSTRFREIHCLRLEFGDMLTASRADQLVVFVDACRTEPPPSGTKGDQDDLADWGKGALRPLPKANVRYAHVYACRRHQSAGYTTGAGQQRSYFTQALLNVLADPESPAHLGELPLQRALDEVIEQDRPGYPQEIHVNHVAGGDRGLLILPRGAKPAAPTAAEHPWVAPARDHLAWQLVRFDDPRRGIPGPGEALVDETRRAVTDVVAAWATIHDQADHTLRAEGDLWRPAGTELRMTLSVESLLRRRLATEPPPGPDAGPALAPLSLTEAALLVLAPFLFVTFGARIAAAALPLTPWRLTPDGPDLTGAAADDRRAFDLYCAGRTALLAREREARQRHDDDAARGVGWWLARQWLVRRRATGPDTYGATLWPPVDRATALDPDAVRRLMGCYGLSLETWTAPDNETIAPQDPHQHTVHWDMVGVLLTVAHHMAVEPVLLPPVVAEHLGIAEPVHPEAFRATLEAARWDDELAGEPRLRTRCQHPAVEVALHQHVAALNRTLGALPGRFGEVARWGVPGRVAAAVSAQRVDGVPVYDVADIRFRMDSDRVRDLLMGERLYENRGLAVRELYQNALDACRYRQARTELFRVRGGASEWRGEITFTQGRDAEGRAYVECTDNGIGMGERELRNLFAHVGSRFVEEQDFLEEQAEWERHGIRFLPNSRFGIGVLSYFMIADRIEVTSARLDHTLRAGALFRVSIAGPGSLFRVQRVEGEYREGTTVRLYLKAEVAEETFSCAEVLRENLWVSDFDVTARTLGESGESVLHRWLPGEVSWPDAHGFDPGEDGARVVRGSARGWWCVGRGALLADGIWVGTDFHGAVVNLTGQDLPPLSLDRNSFQGDPLEPARQILAEGFPSLFGPGADFATLGWVRHLDVPLADRLADYAIAHGKGFDLPVLADTDEQEFVHPDVTVAGCLPDDLELWARGRKSGRAYTVADEQSWAVEWRIRATAHALPELGVKPTRPVPVARPSDGQVLGKLSELPPPWYTAARQRWAVVTGADDRLTDVMRSLGLPTLHLAPDFARRLVSRDLDAVAPWLEPGVPVSARHLHRAALAFASEPVELARVLVALGYSVPEHTLLRAEEAVRQDAARPPQAPSPVPLVKWTVDDLLTRRNLTVEGPELPRDRPVPLWHLLQAAVIIPPKLAPHAALTFDGRTSDRRYGKRLSVRSAARRMGRRGYPVPEPGSLPKNPDDRDRFLMSLDLDGLRPWIGDEGPVPLFHVVRASMAQHRSPREVVERLRALGYVVQDWSPELDEEWPTFRRLLKRTVGKVSHWSSQVAGPRPRRLLAECRRLGLVRDGVPDEEPLLALLRRLGYRPEPLPTDSGHDLGSRLDAVLASCYGNAGQPWWGSGTVLPWHRLLTTAAELGLSRRTTRERLHALGLGTAPEPPHSGWSRAQDLRLLSRDLDGKAPWIPLGCRVPLAHVVRAAHKLRTPPRAVADRLTQLGHELPDDVEFHEPPPR